MKIYLVEDSEVIRERVIKLINNVHDMQIVGTADDVLAAVQGIERSEPDAVILDVRLTNGSGMDVLKQVKKVLPYTKVMILTNTDSDQYRKLAQRYGADAFLDKSSDFLLIPDLLRSWQAQMVH